MTSLLICIIDHEEHFRRVSHTFTRMVTPNYILHGHSHLLGRKGEKRDEKETRTLLEESREEESPGGEKRIAEERRGESRRRGEPRSRGEEKRALQEERREEKSPGGEEIRTRRAEDRERWRVWMSRTCSEAENS